MAVPPATGHQAGFTVRALIRRRPFQVTFDDGTTNGIAYTSTGLQWKTYDEMGHMSEVVYDAAGNTTNLISNDGTIMVVAAVDGSQTNNAVGTWEIEGSAIVAQRRRGFVEYKINFPAQDCYGLNINAAHLWSKSSCTPVTPVDTSAL